MQILKFLSEPAALLVLNLGHATNGAQGARDHRLHSAL